MPACIIGVNFGIIVNTITPEPIVLGALILALIYLTITTGKKWWSVRTRENRVQKITEHRENALKNAVELSSVSSIQSESLSKVKHDDSEEEIEPSAPNTARVTPQKVKEELPSPNTGSTIEPVDTPFRRRKPPLVDVQAEKPDQDINESGRSPLVKGF